MTCIIFLQHHDGAEREKECEKFRENFMRYSELIVTLKNETLVHQSYIPFDIFSAFTAVVKQMQDDLPWWFDMSKFLFAGEYDKINYEKSKESVDALLKQLACAEMLVRSRLKQLSRED